MHIFEFIISKKLNKKLKFLFRQILNLKITTTQTIGGFPVTVTVLSPQDVVTSTQYYAKGIGMVHTNTNITYQLQEFPGVTFPFPSSGSQTQQEFLDTYVAEE